MSLPVSIIDSRIATLETQYRLNSCMISSRGYNGGSFTIPVPGTKIIIPSSGNVRLIWQLALYGGHTGYGSGSDSVNISMFVKNETTNSTIDTSTAIVGGRGAVALQDREEINFKAIAGNTYQLYLQVFVFTDDHVVAFFNGGILWVLPPSQTTAPVSGYLFYN